MDKRKRTASLDYPSSDSVPCSSGRNLTTKTDGFNRDYRRMFRRFSSVKVTTDGQGKQLSSPLLASQHHYNMSRAILSKHNRHQYRNQFSSRSSANYQSHRPSTSNSKDNRLPNDKLCFKLGGGYNPDFGHRQGGGYNPDFGHRQDFTEFREKAFWQPERIRTRQSIIDVLSPEGSKIVCGLCHKQLRRKQSRLFGTALDSEELSIAAILICGHIYHAACLEQTTSLEDIRDPPCPTCSGSVTS